MERRQQGCATTGDAEGGTPSPAPIVGSGWCPPTGTISVVSRSYESLWLWLGGGFIAVDAALLSIVARRSRHRLGGAGRTAGLDATHRRAGGLAAEERVTWARG